jgi:hypothetical protein
LVITSSMFGPTTGCQTVKASRESGLWQQPCPFERVFAVVAKREIISASAGNVLAAFRGSGEVFGPSTHGRAAVGPMPLRKSQSR